MNTPLNLYSLLLTIIIKLQLSYSLYSSVQVYTMHNQISERLNTCRVSPLYFGPGFSKLGFMIDEKLKMNKSIISNLK